MTALAHLVALRGRPREVITRGLDSSEAAAPRPPNGDRSEHRRCGGHGTRGATRRVSEHVADSSATEPGTRPTG